MRPHKEPILAMIRRIAKADTIETYEKSVHDLKTSPMWNADESKHFRRWFSKTWLPEHRYVHMQALMCSFQFNIVPPKRMDGDIT